MLRVEKISYTVKGRKLLKDISFQVRKGEVVALLGANGAGKSTLMSILCGDKKPDSGTVYLNGVALSAYSLKDLSKCRALLSQQQQISLAFKVREIVMMGRYPHFKSQSSVYDKKVVEEVMAICGVADFEDRVFLSLSGGEQQRVQLARVLAQIWDNPDSIILLDEPIAALDLQYQQKVLAIAKALSRKGFMVVLVVHDVNFAAMYADKILMLKHGRKLFDGTPVEVLNTKDIYTVFSVESAVEINPKTLKPFVRLEETMMDAGMFNSTLPCAEQEVSLRDQRELLLKREPYLSLEDVARALSISDLAAIQLDESLFLTYLNSKFIEQFTVLAALGVVQISSKSRSCRHQKTGSFQQGSLHGDVYLFVGKEIDVRWFVERWSVGLILEDGVNKSIHYFDGEGAEILRISLLDEQSNVETFQQMKADFSIPAYVPKSTTQEPKEHRQLSVEQQQAFQQAWEELEDTHAFQTLINRFGITRMQALEYAHTRRVQQVDRDFLKGVFLRAAQTALPIMVFVYNKGGIQIHTGSIVNLIDQGQRYLIKDANFELAIEWENIATLWQVSKPTKDGDVHAVELFDQKGELVLQCFGKRKPGEKELQIWTDLFQGICII